MSKEINVPLRPSAQNRALVTPDSSPDNPGWISDLKNFFVFFRLLGLQSFVMKVIENEDRDNLKSFFTC